MKITNEQIAVINFTQDEIKAIIGAHVADKFKYEGNIEVRLDEFIYNMHMHFASLNTKARESQTLKVTIIKELDI